MKFSEYITGYEGIPAIASTIAITILVVNFSGCCPGADYRNTDPNTLSFKAGEKVKIKNGFYSDCEATISGYAETYNANKKPIDPIYSVVVWCRNIGSDTVVVSESSLAKVTE
jgi:hypothetical protein